MFTLFLNLRLLILKIADLKLYIINMNILPGKQNKKIFNIITYKALKVMVKEFVFQEINNTNLGSFHDYSLKLGNRRT